MAYLMVVARQTRRWSNAADRHFRRPFELTEGSGILKQTQVDGHVRSTNWRYRHSAYWIARWRAIGWRSGLRFSVDVRFATDSPLEQSGFEPSVPLQSDGT